MDLKNFKRVIENTPFIKHLRMTIVEWNDGYAKIHLPFDVDLTGGANAYHGGAIATLVDTAGAMSAWAGHDFNRGMRGSTIGISINYLAAAIETDVYAEGRVLRRGKEIIFSEVDAFTQGGKKVAKGLVTYRIVA